MTPDYGNSFLKHYITKTIEENLEKLKKGYATHTFEIQQSIIIKNLNIFL